MKINSHNEWDKVLEIIVGSADGLVATIEWQSEKEIPEKIKEKAIKLSKKSLSPMVLLMKLMKI